MTSQNRGPGRPATGKGVPITVRLDDDLLSALDEFRSADVRVLNRPQAIREIMKSMLRGPSPTRERRVQELLERSRRRRAEKGVDDAPQ